jgi:hypothetical protein
LLADEVYHFLWTMRREISVVAWCLGMRSHFATLKPDAHHLRAAARDTPAGERFLKLIRLIRACRAGASAKAGDPRFPKILALTCGS